MNALPPPLVHAACGDLPVVLSVPHSGRDYPQWLIDQSRRGIEALRPLEDPLVDRLAWRALQRCSGAVIARAPRAAIDCNRSEDDVDPLMVAGFPPGAVSARARGGLGIVPRRTRSHGQLWRAQLTADVLEQRLNEAHRPYHQALGALVGACVDRFGCALILDCHSMPPLGGSERSPPGLVIGDLHGRSADAWIGESAGRIARAHGVRSSANDPFAGGFVLERHASPAAGIHALQLEFDRSLYLDSQLDRPGPGFDRIARLTAAIAEQLGQQLLAQPPRMAAE